MTPITTEQKAAVYDALVKEFQGQGRHAGTIRRIRRDGITVVHLYDFVMRIAGHNDFEKGIRELAEIPS